jgi:pimeloyl-ACP methyl ester carboxylesterase
MPPAPPTRETTSDGLRIAYQVAGEGPPDVVLLPGFLADIESFWEEQRFASFLERLAGFSRLILSDRRGLGLSERTQSAATLDERILDLLAVLDAAGSERAFLFGQADGGPLSIEFAARHPERTAGLILFSTYARLVRTHDYPAGWPPEFFNMFLEGIEHRWGQGGGVEFANPSVAGDDDFIRWYSESQRRGASAATMHALIAGNRHLDVRAALPSVAAPTLVMHASREHYVPAENGRYLAENIPGARFVEIDAIDHWPWIGPGAGAVVEQVERFVEGRSD